MQETGTVTCTVQCLLCPVPKSAHITVVMSDESSTSSDSNESIRTAFVYVPAFSRLRSLSGNFFAPTGFGRVQNDSSANSIHEATAASSTLTNSLTYTHLNIPTTSPSGK